MAASDRTDGPCGRTAALVGSFDLAPFPLLVSIRSFLFFLIIHKGLCWFSPRKTSLDLAGHNQTANLDTGRLDGRFESHHVLGGWAKRLAMSQKARVAKGHELQRVVSYQGSRVTKGCELPMGVSDQGLRTSRGTRTRGKRTKTYEDQEVPRTEGVHVPNGAC